MTVFFIILLLITFVTAKYCEKGTFNRDTYIGFDQTKMIEGLFTLLVVLTHFRNEFAMNGTYDREYFVFQGHIKQCVVAMFLFYSGYGIMNNIMTKGREYQRKKLPMRLLKLFAQFAIAVTLFVILRAIQGKTYTFRTYALTYLGWTAIGNSNWFIFCTLWMYLFVYLAYLFVSLFAKMDKTSHYIFFLCGLTLLSIGYVAVMKRANKGYWWYDTALVFPLGAWYRLIRNKTDKIIMRSDTSYFITFAVVGIVYVLSWANKDVSFLFYQIWVFSFAMIVVLLSMKVTFRSSLLAFAGSHVFSIYMLQRIPMILVGQEANFVKQHPYLGLVIVIASTIMLAVPFDLLMKKLFSGKKSA